MRYAGKVDGRVGGLGRRRKRWGASKGVRAKAKQKGDQQPPLHPPADQITVNDLTLGLPRVVGDLKLYPNPTVSGKTRLDYQIDRNVKDFELKIWTLSGTEVYQEMIPHQLGKQSITMDVSGFDDGVYLLHLEDSGQNVMIQIKMIVKN